MTDDIALATRPGALAPGAPAQEYEQAETRALVALVDAAADLVRGRGESAFAELRAPGRWRGDESYVFVLDADGNMLVHPDPALEGTNQLGLADVDGKRVVRGLLGVVTRSPQRPMGWYHYRWPVPDGLLPRWKSTYARRVEAPSGQSYVVAAGMYNDRMERAFVVDLVHAAVAEIERHGRAAFPLLRDPRGPFLAKDAYVFVDMDGVELVNPAFPNLEGRNLLALTDTEGRHVARDMMELVNARGAGWVDYMWPKPGESVSTRKSAYVSAAKLGDATLVVGCGVYLAAAPRQPVTPAAMSATELMTLVRDAAAILEEHGEDAFPQLRMPGSRWHRDETYLFVVAMDGTRVLHAAEPEAEGDNVLAMEDIIGRPFGRMFLETAAGPSGEGWVHYMYPRPASLFPEWKSTFVKRVTFPSGKRHVVGSGIYRMRLSRAFIEDVVNRAATLIIEQGQDAFARLRDRTGPFVFMDTYVFVNASDGTALVNPAQPSLEGRKLGDLEDARGKAVVREEIAEAMRSGSAWLECSWWKPGENRPARKETFVRKVRSGADTYIVGSGIYVE